jgi:hypothetical protein
MGKTLVVTSLILASKAKGLKPVTDAAFKNLDVAGAKPMDFGLTLVVVNNSASRALHPSLEASRTALSLPRDPV